MKGRTPRSPWNSFWPVCVATNTKPCRMGEKWKATAHDHSMGGCGRWCIKEGEAVNMLLAKVHRALNREGKSVPELIVVDATEKLSASRLKGLFDFDPDPVEEDKLC